MGNERERDIVYALDAKSGEVAWKHQYKCSFEFNTGRVLWSQNGFGTGGIIMVDETLVILNEGGELVLVRPDGIRYNELARGQVLGGRNWVAPAFSNGLLYCRKNRGKIVCIDLSKRGGIGETRRRGDAETGRGGCRWIFRLMINEIESRFRTKTRKRKRNTLCPFRAFSRV